MSSLCKCSLGRRRASWHQRSNTQENCVLSQARESFREPCFTKEVTASKRVSFPGLTLLFAQTRNALTVSIMFFKADLGIDLPDDHKDDNATIAATSLVGALTLFSTEVVMVGKSKKSVEKA